MGFLDDVADFVTETAEDLAPDVPGALVDVGIGLFGGAVPAIIDTGWGTASGWLDGIDLSPPEIPTAPSFGGLDWGSGFLPDTPTTDADPFTEVIDIVTGSGSDVLTYDPGDGEVVVGGWDPVADGGLLDYGLPEPSVLDWGGYEDPWDDWEATNCWGCGTSQMMWELEQENYGEVFDWETGEWVPGEEIAIDVTPIEETGGDAWTWWDDIVDVVDQSGGSMTEPGDGGLFDLIDYVVEPVAPIDGIDGIDDVLEAVEAAAGTDTEGGGGGFFDTVTDFADRFETLAEAEPIAIEDYTSGGINPAADDDMSFSSVLDSALTAVTENVAENVGDDMSGVNSGGTVNSGNESLLVDDMLLADAASMQIAEQPADDEPAMEYATMAATDDFVETMDLGDTASALTYEEPAFQEMAIDEPAFQETAFQETAVAYEEPAPIAFDEPEPVAVYEPEPVAVYEEPEPDYFSADVQAADATAASADALWDDLA